MEENENQIGFFIFTIFIWFNFLLDYLGLELICIYILYIYIILFTTRSTIIEYKHTSQRFKFLRQKKTNKFPVSVLFF